MKRLAIAAGINMLFVLSCIGCFHIAVIVTPDDARKSVEATAEKASVTYYNESPKVEVKNDVKPVGQEQTFEGFDPEKIPTINELEPE